MELVKTYQELEPLPEPRFSNYYSHSGLLKSNYKSIVNNTFDNIKKPSVFSIKQRVKSTLFNNYCNISTTLKVSVFLVGLLIALV